MQLNMQDKNLENYVLCDLVGEGSFGKVRGVMFSLWPLGEEDVAKGNAVQ